MIDERVKLLEAAAGVGQQTFWNHMKRHNISSPISHQDFVQMAHKIASSPRLESKLDVKERILSLTLPDKFDEVISSERIHQPYLRKSPDEANRDQTPIKAMNNNDLSQTRQPATATPVLVGSAQTRQAPDQPIDLAIAPQTRQASQSSSVSSGLTYAQTAGNTIRKMDGFAGVLMFLSAAGVSYTLYTVGSAFTTNLYFQVFLGIFAIVAAWKWEGALKAQINTFMHQALYKLWGGPGGLILSLLVLITLLAPNIYQGVVAAKKLSSVVAPVHIQNDGTGINDRLIQEKESIAADYERARAALKKEQETAALADPMVAKFADYERSEIQNAKAIRNTAEIRRKEAANYRAKGEKSNANWCIHLANQEEKKAKGADAKAEQWRVKKEQASASVYASYASAFTKLEQDEKAEREAVAARYQGLLVNHTKAEGQKREDSERQNEGIMMIGLIFLPIADFVVLLLIFLKVSYFKRTNQIDPSLKPYKVGEKSKLEQFLSGVVGPAWDTVFGVIMQVGYRYQAMAQASLDGAGAVQQLMKERAVVRHQKYQERIAKRIEEMKKK